jgi:hypothetical protein
MGGGWAFGIFVRMVAFEAFIIFSDPFVAIRKGLDRRSVHTKIVPIRASGKTD